MRIHRFSASILSIVFLLTFTTTSFGQRKVLFESFTNSCQPCPAPQRSPFDDDVASLAGNSKVIHLDYHVANLCDAAAVFLANGSQVALRLAGPMGGGVPVFFAGVDRTTFSSTGTKGSGTSSEWSDAVNSASGAAAVINLLNATIDKDDPSNITFHADVKVTATQSISGKVVIRYALVEDNVTTNDCPSGNSVHNDVVRYVTTGDSVVFASGASAGQSATVGFTQFTLTRQDPRIKLAKMRFIAFLEQQNSPTDYFVINAAILKQDLDTLKAPVATLAIDNSYLDNKVFSPGEVVSIFFTSTNVHSVIVYYSPDNGTTWDTIGFASQSPLQWTVPTTLLTTQGKIKVVQLGGAQLTSTEAGTFTVAPKPSITILHPLSTDTINGGKHFLIQWHKYKVDTVSIKLTYEGASKAILLASAIVNDTFFDWLVPDTSMAATIQIIPTKNETNSGAEAQTSDKFSIIQTIVHGSVGATNEPTPFAIRDVYPSPGREGGRLTIGYSAPEPVMTTIELVDLLGKSVQTQTVYLTSTLGEYSFPIRTISAGEYILHITDGEHVASRRITIVK